MVASGVCVVLASRRAWSLVVGGSKGSVVGCGAGFVSSLYPFFARVCFCLAVSERRACRAGGRPIDRLIVFGPKATILRTSRLHFLSSVAGIVASS